MEKKVISNFQLVDKNIQKVNIDIINKNINYKDAVVNLNLEVLFSDISKKDNLLYSKVTLIANVAVNQEDEKMVTLNMEQCGYFTYDGKNQDEFIKMLKYNGVPILSQTLRVNISTFTALSGIKPIEIPMINYSEYFNEK